MDHQTINYAVTGVVVAIVLLLRLRRMRQARRLRVETLWVVPAIFLLVLAVTTWERPPPTPLGWLWLLLAIGIGAVVGWQRGKLMRLSVDPATHALNQQSSPAALLFIVALILVRQGLRFEAAQLGINLLTVTTLLVGFGFGLIGATRAEMYLRAKTLLAAARLQTPSGISTGPTTSR